MCVYIYIYIYIGGGCISEPTVATLSVKMCFANDARNAAEQQSHPADWPAGLERHFARLEAGFPTRWRFAATI